jgi:hypothetical protein
MSFFTVILFFIYTYGLGFSITRLVKESENILERNIMRVGIGLGVFTILGVILGVFHVPIDWKIFFILSFIAPIIWGIRAFKNGTFRFPKIKLTKSNLSIIFAILIFAASLFMYTSGAFKYPWLEDDDPWTHALGIKYITTEKKITEPLVGKDIFNYIEPYPPGYGILMGVLHQTSQSMRFTLKFFNALIISLGIIFFYFFVKQFTDRRNKALFSTFVLAAIPSYLSHFIWAHSLVMTLFIVSLYCLIRIERDKRWIYPTIAVISAAALTQPTQPIKFLFIYAIYFIVKSIYKRKFQVREFIGIAGGYLLSLVWWFNNWQDMFGVSHFGLYESGSSGGNIIRRAWHLLQRAFCR